MLWGGGINSKDHFYFAKTASNIADAIVEEWIDDFIANKKNNKNRNNFDPKYDKVIKEALKTASQRKFVSATLVDDKHTNDFNEEEGIFYTLNTNYPQLQILAANSSDAMTSNKEHFVVPNISMTSKQAFDYLKEWHKRQIQIINGGIADSSLTRDEKLSEENKIVDLFDSLQQKMVQIKQDTLFLYESGYTSTRAKNELETFCDKDATKLASQIANASPNVQKKYSLLQQQKQIIDIEKQIQDMIKKYNAENLITEIAFTYYNDLEKTAKNNCVLYKDGNKKYPIFEKNKASISEIKPWDKYYTDLFKSAFFGSNKQEKQNARSEFAGLTHMGLRYLGDKSLEDNRFYVFSKNVPMLSEEIPQKHGYRILEKTKENSRNELIISIDDAVVMNRNKNDDVNQTYFYGTDETKNPMKTMNFYVPDLDKYAGDTPEERAKNAIMSELGIKTMLPMLSFFGKNAFAEGVFVYSPQLKKTIKIADYQKVLEKMDKRKNKITFKGFDNSQEWLKNCDAVLNAQTEYVHWYVEKANNLCNDKQYLQDKVKIAILDPKMLGKSVIKPNAMSNTAQDVINPDKTKRLGSATSYALPNSNKNSRPQSAGGSIFRISRENTQDKLKNMPSFILDAKILSSRLTDEQIKIENKQDDADDDQMIEYFDIKSKPINADNLKPKPHLPIIINAKKEPKGEKSMLELSNNASKKRDNLFKK